MTKRMSLVEGMQRDKEQLDPVVVDSFIKQGNTQPKSEPEIHLPDDSQDSALSNSLTEDRPGRAPRRVKQAAVMSPGLISVNVRVRPEIGAALQTASLQRQLQGVEPFSKREIVEEALEPWLRENGYLP